ncbi:MAG: purine-nucleoside phosphorylase [Lachnospiraceae bacterium]|nr:purine-nucleoside phosphorylase [Lachnospiraceae bacterium]
MKTAGEQALFCALNSIKDRITDTPDIALVLGSGLGAFANQLEDAYEIPYSQIEGFPVSTVTGHAGKYVIGKIGSKRVIAMQGRVHYYEGYSMEQVVMPIRIMKLLGADTLILTNAAGGISYEFKQGTLMMITDHITSFVPSPLIGANMESLGTRFPDMSQVYDLKLQQILKDSAVRCGIDLKQGTYLQTTGPNYETPAEIRMYRTLGADAVGMSTACEAMIAKHMGMRIAGVSCITNLASGMSEEPLNHEEVKATADRIAKEFEALIREFILSID